MKRVETLSTREGFYLQKIRYYLMRTVRTSPEDERVRLVAGDRENYDDIVLNINDIVAVYKIKGNGSTYRFVVNERAAMKYAGPVTERK